MKTIASLTSAKDRFYLGLGVIAAAVWFVLLGLDASGTVAVCGFVGVAVALVMSMTYIVIHWDAW